MKYFLPLAVVLTYVALFASAECPNACAGHGTCGAYDQCTCYRNFQSADCSERTCPFGNSHVSTAKGNLDGSSHSTLGRASVTESSTGDAGTAYNAGNTGNNPEKQSEMLFGSTVYPYGTSESVDFDGCVKDLAHQTGCREHNFNQDNGHHYMECSNKGLCDRKTGECECFEGYEGTACQRASCPNDCSGHGTCETIQELAEDRQWGDTTGMLGSTTTLHQFFGYTEHHTTGSIDAVTTKTYTNNRLTRGTFFNGGAPYFLWDRRVTMGCKCDPVYFGADCSLRRCKYGIDPLYTGGGGVVTTEKTIVGIQVGGLDAAAATAAPAPAVAYGAKFDITFYDVFGEDYTYYDVTATAETSLTVDATETSSATSCSDITSIFPNDMLSDTGANAFCTLTMIDGCKSGASNGAICDAKAMATLVNDGTLTETANFVLHSGTSSALHPEWVFDYGTGNPGFIKDIKITNLRDARDAIDISSSAALPFGAVTYLQPTFYMKRESDGQWSDLVTTTTFDFFLPGYVQYVPTDQSSFEAYHSENLDQYLAATATASKSDALTVSTNGAATDKTVSGIEGVWTFGLTPLDFPTDASSASEWNTYKYASKITLNAALGAGTYFAGGSSAIKPATLLLAADTELLKTKLKLNFEYVSMCSNRGSCDTDSGLCKCYAGYTGDNCDTQTSIV